MARDQQILDAAEALFYRRGFDAVGVAEIGQAAGITGGAIYRHFDSKHEILAILIDRALDVLLGGLPPVDPDPAAELCQLARATAELARTHRRLAGIWQRDHRALPAKHRRKYQRRLGTYVDRWVNCLDRLYPGHSSERLRSATRAVQMLLLSDATRSNWKPDGSAKVAELLVRMCVLSLSAIDEVSKDPGAVTGRHINGRSP